MEGRSWLLDVPELYERRAPGNTCIYGLSKRAAQGRIDDFIKEPINNSKGCGGIMRIAPLALRYRIGENPQVSIERIDMQAAQIAAITHSHSLGYMPAAVLSHILSRIMSADPHMSLKEIVLDAGETIAKLFDGDTHIQELQELINFSISLAEEEGDDLDHIHALGEGWVAEETLAIALYCTLKYQDDFSKAITAAVNHNGDSDSTGAVTGNIVGALVGYDVIDEKWKKNLELSDVILKVVDDLSNAS